MKNLLKILLVSVLSSILINCGVRKEKRIISIPTTVKPKSIDQLALEFGPPSSLEGSQINVAVPSTKKSQSLENQSTNRELINESDLTESDSQRKKDQNSYQKNNEEVGQHSNQIYEDKLQLPVVLSENKSEEKKSKTKLSLEECPILDKIAAKGFEYRLTEVPEDWSNLNSEKIKVFYYYYKPEKLSKNAPVVFYNGGPTGSSHSSYERLKDFFVGGKTPIVFIDQRGTGCSSHYPTEKEINENTLNRLMNYGSEAIVRDSETIRKELLGENQKWTIFGQSYGGFIVSRYIQIAPEGVDKALSHGFAHMENSKEWLKRRMLSQKRVAENYLKQYPGDRKLLQEVRESIPDDLCFSDGNIEVCGHSILDGLSLALGFSNLWPNLNEWITHFYGAKNDQSKLEKALERFGKTYIFSLLKNYYVAGDIISNREFGGGGRDVDACKEVMEVLKEEGHNSNDWFIVECRLSIATTSIWDDKLSNVTAIFPTPFNYNDVSQNLKLFPEISFFLYAGRSDTFVPLSTFEEVEEKLDGLMTFRIFESGHEGFATELEIWQDLLGGKEGKKAFHRANQ